MSPTKAPADGEFRIIPMDKISPAKDNVRSDVGDITDLAVSIKNVGILEPVLVTSDGNGSYVLVAGARRFAAARKARVKEIPAIVRVLEDGDRVELMLIENLQREDLTPLDQGKAFRRLIDDHGYTQRALAERIGVNQSHISRRLSLMALPEEAHQALATGKIDIAGAIELTRLKDPVRVRSALKEIGKGPYYTPEHAVAEQLQDMEREKRRNKVVQDLQDAGVRILNPAEAKKATRILHYGGAKDLAHVDAAKHRKKPCAGVVVTAYGNTEDFCTEPTNHPAPPGQQKEADRRKGERAAEAARRSALEQAAQTRLAFMAGIVGKLSKPDAAELLATALVFGDPESNPEAACRLVGLLPIAESQEDLERIQTGRFDEVSAIRTYATAGKLAQAGAAAAMSSLDPDWSYSGWVSEGTKWFFGFLARQGYEISKAEKAAMAGRGK